MTFSPDAQRLSFDNLAEAVHALRELGLRLSTARRLILEALFSAGGPVSAVHLSQMLSVDESSVYRNLEVLEAHGMVGHVHLGHGPGLYVLLGQDEVEYAYCERCARVTAVAPHELDRVRREIRRAVGHEARFTHFAIVGLCVACASQPDSTPTDQTNSEQVGHAHSHGDLVHSHSHQHTGAHQH